MTTKSYWLRNRPQRIDFDTDTIVAFPTARVHIYNSQNECCVIFDARIEGNHLKYEWTANAAYELAYAMAVVPGFGRMRMTFPNVVYSQVGSTLTFDVTFS